MIRSCTLWFHGKVELLQIEILLPTGISLSLVVFLPTSPRYEVPFFILLLHNNIDLLQSQTNDTKGAPE